MSTKPTAADDETMQPAVTLKPLGSLPLLGASGGGACDGDVCSL